MRHHLPLSASSASREETHWDGPRLTLPWPAIGIADTARGLEALDFALALGEAAHAANVPVRVSVLDFARQPAIAGAQRERFERVATLRTLQATTRGLDVSGEAGVLQLWVGLPALIALAPALGVLIGTQRPPLEWPSALRGAQVALALAAPRPGLARVLVEELNVGGFLPARSHGVR